jgi:lipid-binding SYLF domain-containing protein
MKKRQFMASSASLLLLAVAAGGCTTTSSGRSDPDTRRQAINAGVDNSLQRLYNQVPGSKEMVASARGVLVFPNFVSAGFIVGGASGEGALRQGGKTTGFYRMTEGSVGFLAGAQSQALFVLFMTEEALNGFKSSKGWTAGVDGSVTMINVGANASVDTRTVQQSIVGFALTNGGLMGNVSVNGSRVTPLGI